MQSTPRPIRSVLWGTMLSIALVGSGCSKSESGSSPGGSTDSAGKAGSSSVASAGAGGSNGGNASASSAGEAGQGGSSASGGASAKGGSSQSSSAGGSCPAATTCAGGDVVGTWTVSSSCLKISGEIEMTTFGAKCPTAKVTGSLQVTGSFTARANGTYLDKTITTGEEQLELEPDCLIISSTPTNCSGAAGLLKGGLGLDSLECTPVTGGGCTCKGTVKQDGMMGVPSGLASPDGSYKAVGNVLTYDEMLDYSYCVAGDKLTVTPKPSAPTFTGSIVLQKTTPGTGGTGGQTTGGSKASGGTTTGGQVTTGGSRTGGTSASGGAAGGTSATGGTGGAAGGTGTAGPCDIYGAANNPCVAAHSVVRALFGAYRGKLYQIAKSDGTTLDVLTGADGIADTKPEDTFCTGTTCSLTVIYDQTKNANDLWWQGSEKVPAPKSSTAAKATADPVNVAGHKVYSAFIRPGNCYWHDGSKSGMAIGAEPEAMYMVSSARNTNGGCCYDYGNSETTRAADVGGAMDSLNVSSITAWGTGAGNGPWIMADMEWGVFCQQDNKKNPNNPSQTAPFLTAMLKNNGTTEYALKGGDATVSTLPTIYKGKGPYNPMKKQGAIILGCGGDCCKPCAGCGSNASSGIFFEGAIVKGYPADATEEEVQKNIAAVGYGK